MAAYHLVSTFSEGRTTARAFSPAAHHSLVTNALPHYPASDRSTDDASCNQPYLDHPAPTASSGVSALFSQDQPQHRFFFASYGSHLELISPSLDSHFAARGRNQALTCRIFLPRMFCLTWVNDAANSLPCQSNTCEPTARPRCKQHRSSSARHCPFSKLNTAMLHNYPQ